MNYFTTAVLAGTLVTLIVGVLLGLLRGMRRSVLRLALLVLCLVLALAICPAVSETVMNVKISDGKTLETLLTENFSNGGEAAVDIVVPIAQILAKLIAFIMLFGILQFVTWIIVFPILKLILRPLIGRRATQPHAWRTARLGLRCAGRVRSLRADERAVLRTR